MFSFVLSRSLVFDSIKLHKKVSRNKNFFYFRKKAKFLGKYSSTALVQSNI